MKSIEEHLIEVESATRVYVDAYNTRRTLIIEAARDGCTVDQLAEASRLPRPAVAAILGEEYPPPIELTRVHRSLTLLDEEGNEV